MSDVWVLHDYYYVLQQLGLAHHSWWIKVLHPRFQQMNQHIDLLERLHLKSMTTYSQRHLADTNRLVLLTLGKD